MFPRFPKARPWAARSPKAVTSDKFSLSGNKKFLKNKQGWENHLLIFIYKSNSFFFFFLWAGVVWIGLWGPQAGYLTSAIELTSLAVSLFQILAKEASARTLCKGGVHSTSCPVCPCVRGAPFSGNSPPQSSGKALLGPCYGPSPRPSQGTWDRVTKCTQLLAPLMSFSTNWILYRKKNVNKLTAIMCQVLMICLCWRVATGNNWEYFTQPFR